MTERPETIRLRNEATAARSHREQMHRERAWRERMLEAEADARMAARKKEAVQLDADSVTISQGNNGDIAVRRDESGYVEIYHYGIQGIYVDAESVIPLAMALLQLTGWQSMDTAPVNGDLILAKRGDCDPITAFYDDTPGTERWCSATGDRLFLAELTGWLPLPKMGRWRNEEP